MTIKKQGGPNKPKNVPTTDWQATTKTACKGGCGKKNCNGSCGC